MRCAFSGALSPWGWAAGRFAPGRKIKVLKLEESMAYSESTVQHEEKRAPVHCSNRDFDFFYQGLEQRRLLVQQCARCGTLRNPPGPCCPACRSLDWKPVELRGTGTVFSHTVHHHPPLDGFEVPHPIVLVETDEGIRIVGPMDGAQTEPRIGMRVRVEFLRRGAVASFRFGPDFTPL
jgi:hypothetical protein